MDPQIYRIAVDSYEADEERFEFVFDYLARSSADGVFCQIDTFAQSRVRQNTMALIVDVCSAFDPHTLPRGDLFVLVTTDAVLYYCELYSYPLHRDQFEMVIRSVACGIYIGMGGVVSPEVRSTCGDATEFISNFLERVRSKSNK